MTIPMTPFAVHLPNGDLLEGDISWVLTPALAPPPPPPVPTPPPTPTPPPAPGGWVAPTGPFIFDGSCADGTLSAFGHVEVNHPGAATVIPAPGGRPGKAIQLTTLDTDNNNPNALGRVPDNTHNPATSVNSPGEFIVGTDVFIGGGLWVSSVPLVLRNLREWCQVWESYGKPYGGSPSCQLALMAVSGVNHLVMFRQDSLESPQYAPIWLGPPIPSGAYLDWHVHINYQANNSGFVEVYINKQIQKLFDGSTRLSYATLDPGVDWDGSSPNTSDWDLYHSKGLAAQTQVVHYWPRVTKTLAQG